LFSLKGRVALVTGGSKGLGKAIARGLAKGGCDVVISARSEPELKSALVEILAGTTAKGQYVVCDLSVAAP
jgi:NAD(P)-dependent dehydrogenase (short-subunit alcohol dehydrogenase family)